MVDYSSFTDARVNRVKLNEKLRDAIASLSVTRLARGNKIVFRWQKRIKNSKAYPTLTLGSYPSLTINEARRIALEYDGLAEKGIHPRDKEEEERKTDEKLSVTLREALDRYTMWRAEKNSQGTIKHRHDSISLIFADYMDKPIRLLTVEVVNDIYHYWKSQRVAPNRKNKNGSPYSAKNGVKYLNSIFNYCVIFKILDENPILPILKPLGIFEKPKSRGIYLQPKECERLILDLLWTGLRVGDVARLKWEDVFMKGNEEEKTPHFTLKIQKNQDRPFAVPLTNSMRRIFSYMQKMKLNSPYVFPRIKDTTAMPYTEIFKNKKGEDKVGKWMINSKKQLKKRYKRVHELRIDKTNGFGSLKRVCENIQMYSFPKGFKDKKTKKMIPQLLRHNFATHGRMCGLTNEQLQMITGHSNSFDDRQMGNALLNYVRNLVVVNKPLFERVEEGMHGDLYKEIIL
jgi:integrase